MCIFSIRHEVATSLLSKDVL